MAGRKGGPKKGEGEEIEPSPTSPIDEAEKVPETVNIETKPEPKPDLKKIRVRLASTGTFLANMVQRQFSGSEVDKYGQIKLNQWIFNKAEIKTVYVTPEISNAIKNGIFEILNPNPPEEVDES